MFEIRGGRELHSDDFDDLCHVLDRCSQRKSAVVRCRQNDLRRNVRTDRDPDHSSRDVESRITAA